jgi:hypothetical protein
LLLGIPFSHGVTEILDLLILYSALFISFWLSLLHSKQVCIGEFIAPASVRGVIIEKVSASYTTFSILSLLSYISVCALHSMKQESSFFKTAIGVQT